MTNLTNPTPQTEARKIDVSVFNWGKRGFRVRAWQTPPAGQDFGRILSETFVKGEARARAAAARLAAQYGVTVSS